MPVKSQKEDEWKLVSFLIEIKNGPGLSHEDECRWKINKRDKIWQLAITEDNFKSILQFDSPFLHLRQSTTDYIPKISS